ncbi:hypothetical protein C1645_835435, partial [Glomus cerebriforme]
YDIYDLTTFPPQVKSLEHKVLTIEEPKLKLMNDLVNLINNEKNLTNLPEEPIAFDNRINTLPNDNTLPVGYRKDDIVKFYKKHRQKVVDDEFIREFASQGTEATNFAANLANRETILDYRKKSTDMYGDEHEISGEDAGKIYQNADNPAGNTEILNFRKVKTWGFGAAAPSILPPVVARNYGSDNGFDPEKIDRLQLDRVNQIIADIATANLTILNTTLSETNIEAGYNQNKVPSTKNYVTVKAIRKTKENQLQQTQQDQTDRTTAITEINNYLTQLNLSSSIENILGND